MAAAGIVEPIDILEYSSFCLATCIPAVAPDELCLDGFEEGLNHGIVVAIAFTAHRYLEAILQKALLIVVRTILRPAIRMVNAALWRLSQCHGHVQRPDRQIPLHTAADGPADNATGIQIKDDSQIQRANRYFW